MTELGQRLLRRFNTVSWGGTYSQNADVAQAANITATHLHEHPCFNSNQASSSLSAKYFCILF